MNIESLREYCLSKPGSEESFPFGNDVLAFKIKGKVFLLTTLEKHPLQFNVKCDPEKAIQLREAHDCILPGYHMNKKYWNTVIIDGTLSDSQLRELTDNSYSLVKGVKK